MVDTTGMSPASALFTLSRAFSEIILSASRPDGSAGVFEASFTSIDGAAYAFTAYEPPRRSRMR